MESSLGLSIPADATTSFHLFPNLPVEIRLKIWNLSILQTPRMVKIHVAPSPNQNLLDRVNTLYEEKDCRACRYRWHEFVPTPDIPLHFEICFESRVEALRHYQKGLTSRLARSPSYLDPDCRHREETNKLERPFYFSPEVDLVFITSQEEWFDSPEVVSVSPIEKLSDIWVLGSHIVEARILCMTERLFTDFHSRRSIPPSYEGIEYILLLWGEEKRPRLGNIIAFGREFQESENMWEDEKVFLEKIYTEAMEDFLPVLGESHARKIEVKIGKRVEDLLEEARKIGTGRSQRNQNPR